MSSEEPKISRAFLQSVLRAESAEATEPDEIVDPETDQRLATQLADKYAVSPKAKRWFGRPWLVVGAVAVAAAAAVMILMPPISPQSPSLTAFSLQVKATDRVLQAEPAQPLIRLHESPSWELSLSAQIAVSGELLVRSFVRQADTLRSHPLALERVGNNFKVRVESASLLPLQSPAELCLVICRTANSPSDSQLQSALAHTSLGPSDAGQSVRLSLGDCQLASIRVEP